jgi:hypothetical protein
VSKKIMCVVGTPLFYDGADKDIELLKLEVDNIGYSVLI